MTAETTTTPTTDIRATDAPTGMTAEGVVDVYRRVLEDPEAHADTDFFDAGGDSLLATRVLAAAARATGVELTMEDFLMAPTPALLAARLAEGAVAR